MSKLKRADKNLQTYKRLERTRHERASLVGCVSEPLKRSVILLGDSKVSSSFD